MISTYYEFKNLKGEIYCLIPFDDGVLYATGIKSNYTEWFNDQEVTKYNSHGLFPYGKKALNDYLDSLENPTDKIVLAICHKQENNYIHIGNCSLQSINWINRSAELAIIIGEKEYWGKGIATKACECLLKHGFDKLNLNRVWTGTAVTNEGMCQVAENLGMADEGRFKSAVYLNGKYEDVSCYSILRNEYNFIKEN